METLDLRPGGSTDRVRARERLYRLADETSNPEVMRALVDSWFYNMGAHAAPWAENRLAAALGTDAQTR